MGGRQYEHVELRIGGVDLELRFDRLGPQDLKLGHPDFFKGAQVTLLLGSGKDGPLATHSSNCKILKVKYAKRILALLTDSDYELLELQLDAFSSKGEFTPAALEADVPVRLVDGENEWYPICAERDTVEASA